MSLKTELSTLLNQVDGASARVVTSDLAADARHVRQALSDYPEIPVVSLSAYRAATDQPADERLIFLYAAPAAVIADALAQGQSAADSLAEWASGTADLLRAYRAKRRQAVMAPVDGAWIAGRDAAEAASSALAWSLMSLVAAEILRRDTAAQDILGELEASSRFAPDNSAFDDPDAFCSATLQTFDAARQVSDLQKALSDRDAGKKAAVAETVAELEDTRRVLEATRAELNATLTDRDMLEGARDHQTAQLALLTAELNTVQQALDRAMAQNTALATAEGSLKQRLAEARDEADMIMDRLLKAQEQIRSDNSAQLLRAAQEEIATLGPARDQYRKTAEEATAQVRTLTAQLAEAGAMRDAARRAEKDIQAQLAEIRSLLEAERSAVTLAGKEQDAVKAQMADQTDRLRQLEAQLHQLREGIAGSQQQLAATETERDSLAQQLRDTEAERDATLLQLFQTQERLQEAAAEKALRDTRLEELAGKLRAREVGLQELGQRMREAEDQSTMLQDSFAASRAEVTALLDRMFHIGVEMDRLRGDVAAKDAELAHVYGSHSLRVTAPLRWLRGLFQ